MADDTRSRFATVSHFQDSCSWQWPYNKTWHTVVRGTWKLWRPSVENVTLRLRPRVTFSNPRGRSLSVTFSICHTEAAPSCDIFKLGSSYFHVPLTTVRHLLNITLLAWVERHHHHHGRVYNYKDILIGSAHGCDQQTHRHADHATSVAIGRISVLHVHAMRPKNSPCNSAGISYMCCNWADRLNGLHEPACTTTPTQLLTVSCSTQGNADSWLIFTGVYISTGLAGSNQTRSTLNPRKLWNPLT